MRPLRRLRIAALALTVAMTALPACRGAASTPTWTPAARVTAPARTFHWGSTTELRGKLVGGAWTPTESFTLPAGPATVVGILKVPGSTQPLFTARLLPVPGPPSFAGYSLGSGGPTWVLPSIPGGGGAIAGWFPYQLPAGGYRLLVRETRGGGSGGSYYLNVAGVK